MAAKIGKGERGWTVYIVRCRDGSLYTGVAKDVDARVERHNSGKGAAYTRARRPVALTYREAGFSRSGALVREAQIKRLPRGGKQNLVAGGASYFLKRAAKARSSASGA